MEEREDEKRFCTGGTVTKTGNRLGCSCWRRVEGDGSFVKEEEIWRMALWKFFGG